MKKELDLRKTPIMLFSKRLTHIKHSQLIIKDIENIDGIKKLREKGNYLLNSYIMNLVASWQVFIEELLEFGLNLVIEKNSLNPAAIEILKSNFEVNKKRFNTPNIKNIDQIFKNVLAIKKITDNISIQGMGLNEVKDKVNKLLEIRHKIAHTGFTDEELDLESNFDFMKHLFSVGEQIESKVKQELNGKKNYTQHIK